MRASKFPADDYLFIEETDDGITVATVTPVSREPWGYLSEKECLGIATALVGTILPGQRLVLDLDEVNFAAKLSDLVLWPWRRVRELSGAMKVSACSTDLRDLLHCTRLSRVIEIYSDRDAALAAFRAALPRPCPDCHGSGQYVGLNVIETCSRCGGTGEVQG